jgi:hypothetical protein
VFESLRAHQLTLKPLKELASGLEYIPNPRFVLCALNYARCFHFCADPSLRGWSALLAKDRCCLAQSP